ELKKSAKGVSIVIQSLLDLALTREDGTFRKDVRVSLASSGLYEWLLKIIRVSGMIGSEKGEGVPDEEAKKDRDQEKHGKKPMLAMCRLMPLHSKFPLSLVISRRSYQLHLHHKDVKRSLVSMWIEQKTS
ncbi:hypothetical protein BD769DRAFT_1289961, partial [Suillus cothurnatus]